MGEDGEGGYRVEDDGGKAYETRTRSWKNRELGERGRFSNDFYELFVMDGQRDMQLCTNQIKMNLPEFKDECLYQILLIFLTEIFQESDSLIFGVQHGLKRRTNNLNLSARRKAGLFH